MDRSPGTARIGYLTATFAVVASYGLMESWPALAVAGRSLILLASVTLVAAAGGFGPALLAIVGSTPMLFPGPDWYLHAPQQVRLVLFWGLGLTTAIASHLLRRATRQREELIERQAVGQEAAKRRETERVLLETDRRLAAIVDSNVIGVVLLEDDRIIDANRAFLELLDASRADVLGRPLASITHAEDLARDRAAHEELVRSGRFDAYEKRFVTADGAAHHALVAGARVEGTAFRSITFVQDLEDRKRHEIEREDLLAREQSARLAAEAASDAATFLAEATATLSATLDARAALERVVRLAVPRFADACAIDLVRQGGDWERVAQAHAAADGAASSWTFAVDVESGENAIARTIRTGSTAWVPWTAQPRGGSPPPRASVPRSFVCAPIALRGRALGALTLCFGPDSERIYGLEEVRLAEELGARCAVALENADLYAKLGEARAEAEAASRARERFLATLSHELRTPLNTTSILVDLLRSGRLPEDRRSEALETIRRNVRVQLRLLEDLLDTSRVISGKLTIELESMTIGECVRRAIATLRPLIDPKKIRLTVDGDGDLLVRADPERLEQVLVNLLGNAAKFSAEGGEVRVSIGGEDRAIVVRIADDGEGIPATLLPHVFEPFRSSEGRKDGLGLGLAIAHRIVSLHGGSLEAASDGPGRGATLTLRLPRYPLQAVAAPGVAPLEGIRLLVAGGSGEMRRSTGASLAALGADVTIVASASEALTTLAQDRPDVLVAEQPIPDLAEPELLRRLRAAEEECGDPPLPVLTISEVDLKDEACIDGVVRVPASTAPEELARTIRELVGRTTARDASS